MVTKTGVKREPRKDNQVATIAIEYTTIGWIKCPEEDGCDEVFETIDLLIQHLAHTIVARGYTMKGSNDEKLRKCILCNHTWKYSIYKNKFHPVLPHVSRHFPQNFPCHSACGGDDCQYVGKTSKNLTDHCATVAAKLKHKCQACNKRFAQLQHVENHVEQAHVRQHQVLGFAMKAGYNVETLLRPAPWMAGPSSKSAIEQTSALKLAENALNGILSTRQVNREPRNEAAKSVPRCQACEKAKRACFYTHHPSPLCFNCSLDCRSCRH